MNLDRVFSRCFSVEASWGASVYSSLPLCSSSLGRDGWFIINTMISMTKRQVWYFFHMIFLLLTIWQIFFLLILYFIGCALSECSLSIFVVQSLYENLVISRSVVKNRFLGVSNFWLFSLMANWIHLMNCCMK